MIERVDNDEVETETFLQCFEGHASKIYPVVFGGEGMLSGQLSGDLDNNLDKIRRHFEANRQTYTTLEQLVSQEVAKKGKDALLSEKDVAVKGLLWLTRTLDFICTLIEKLASRNDKTPAVLAQETYSATLEKYHGWMGRTAFSSALTWMTDIDNLLELFGFSNEADFKIAAEELTTKLRPYVTENYALLDKYDVHFQYKVM